LGQALGKDAKEKGKSLGLDADEIEAVLRAKGIACHCHVHEPPKGTRLKAEYQRTLYGFLESGFPALVGFQTRNSRHKHGSDNKEPAPRHMICAIGHTFNEDTWVPAAQPAYFATKLGYYPSENWLSSFVVHDDNVGLYQCIPRHFLQERQLRILIGLLRHPTNLTYTDAEAVAFTAIAKILECFPITEIMPYWYIVLAVFHSYGIAVLRTIQVKREEYIDYLKNNLGAWYNASFEPEHLASMESTLPEWFWVSSAESVGKLRFG
jgi:hypothetical protein